MTKPLVLNLFFHKLLVKVNLGLDCNNAHVQPTGKYHYHGSPTLYLQNANIPANQMTLVGYAADDFPIYYKYAYTNASDNTSTIIEIILRVLVRFAYELT